MPTYGDHQQWRASSGRSSGGDIASTQRDDMEQGCSQRLGAPVARDESARHLDTPDWRFARGSNLRGVETRRRIRSRRLRPRGCLLPQPLTPQEKLIVEDTDGNVLGVFLVRT